MEASCLNSVASQTGSLTACCCTHMWVPHPCAARVRSKNSYGKRTRLRPIVVLKRMTLSNPGLNIGIWIHATISASAFPAITRTEKPPLKAASAAHKLHATIDHFAGMIARISLHPRSRILKCGRLLMFSQPHQIAGLHQGLHFLL